MDKKMNVQLSPPWITYFNELKNTIGTDPEVTMGPLIPVDSQYIAIVTTTNNEKAAALATLLDPSIEFGNVTLTVIIVNNEQEIVTGLPCPLRSFAVAELVQVALEGNPYFERVVVKPQLPGGPNAVYPVFKAEVIQFFNDDISNLCNSFTGVASTVFSDVMKDDVCGVAILFSTDCEE
ncbi:hypothetical protein CN378_21610 [Bacillus sp. AFS015802]|uniref:hypothetical protein n=1 Tax=Bacillus sp. AFS015802 TaxID=2033486 RepID=UPI000BF96F8A|nr:hypothetical protein [Bacillus sp. AFS015802]PFA62207.1 hypothetical protein CN378_21610 [Bacillus sp. AFS015802]